MFHTTLQRELEREDERRDRHNALRDEMIAMRPKGDLEGVIYYLDGSVYSGWYSKMDQTQPSISENTYRHGDGVWIEGTTGIRYIGRWSDDVKIGHFDVTFPCGVTKRYTYLNDELDMYDSVTSSFAKYKVRK